MKYLAAFPFAYSLGERCFGATRPAGCSSWYIILHGLFIVQSPSPKDRNLIRLIFPKVDGAGHKHSYRCNGIDLNTSFGYTLYVSGSGSMPPYPDTNNNVIVPKGKVAVRDESSNLAQYAACWLDLPSPASIVPLRSRKKDDCGITFSGSVGSGITATYFPTAVAFGYNLAANSVLFSDLPGKTLNYNLVLRSEPKDIPNDEGEHALQALCDCLRLQADDLKMYQSNSCCPPDPDGSNPCIPTDDQQTLQEKNHKPCKSTKGGLGLRGLQPRACMTVFVS